MTSELRTHMRLGIFAKTLHLEIAGDQIWKLFKADLLSEPARIIFKEVRAGIEYSHMVKEDGGLKAHVDWRPIPDTLGVVRRKAVLARIIARKTTQEVIAHMNELARREEAGPIMNGILSDENGRAYLTAPGLGWGWKLERDDRLSSGPWYLTRHLSKRVSVIREPVLYFSKYGSLLIPVKELISSVLSDFGSFADPYSVKEFRNKKSGPVLYKYIEIPWIATGQPAPPKQMTLTQGEPSHAH